MFRATLCSSSWESIVFIHLVCVTLCRWPSTVHVWMELVHQFHLDVHTWRSPTFMTTTLEGNDGSASRSGRSLLPGKDPVPIVQEAGWAPGPVGTGAKNLALTRIRSPDRPALSQSLYQLSYPATNFTYYCMLNHWYSSLLRALKL
jgi:hypothetical protein